MLAHKSYVFLFSSAYILETSNSQSIGTLLVHWMRRNICLDILESMREQVMAKSNGTWLKTRLATLILIVTVLFAATFVSFFLLNQTQSQAQAYGFRAQCQQHEDKEGNSQNRGNRVQWNLERTVEVRFLSS